MAFSPIPNSTFRRRVQAGTEVVPGTAVAPTFKLYGDLVVTKRTPLVDRPSYAGTYDVDYSPVYGPPEIDGTYAQVLTYQDIPILARYWIAGDPSGSGDAGSPEAFTYAIDPTAAADDLDRATFEFGFDGIVFRATAVVVNEGTIRGNADDAANAWMFDSRLFVREKALQIGLEERATTVAEAGGVHVFTPAGGGLTASALVGQYLEVMSGPGASQVGLITANTTTAITIDRLMSPAPDATSTVEVSGEFTSGLSDRTTDTIDFAGTELYVGDEGDTLGTDHRIVGRFKAFSVTLANNISPKRMADDVGAYSAKIDRGARRVTAQITMEFDDWRELARWEEKATRLVRIGQPNGPIIHDAVRNTARIDLPGLYWEQMSEEVRNNNILATYQGRGYVDSVLGYSIQLGCVTDLAATP